MGPMEVLRGGLKKPVFFLGRFLNISNWPYRECYDLKFCDVLCLYNSIHIFFCGISDSGINIGIITSKMGENYGDLTNLTI